MCFWVKGDGWDLEGGGGFSLVQMSGRMGGGALGRHLSTRLSPLRSPALSLRPLFRSPSPHNQAFLGSPRSAVSFPNNLAVGAASREFSSQVITVLQPLLEAVMLTGYTGRPGWRPLLLPILLSLANLLHAHEYQSHQQVPPPLPPVPLPESKESFSVDRGSGGAGIRPALAAGRAPRGLPRRK